VDTGGQHTRTECSYDCSVVVKPAGAEVPIHVLNLRDNPVTIPKGTAIAEMELLPECSTMTVASTQERTSDVTEEPDDFGRTGSLKHKISNGDAQPFVSRYAESHLSNGKKQESC